MASGYTGVWASGEHAPRHLRCHAAHGRPTPPPARASCCGSSGAGASTDDDLRSRVPAFRGLREGRPDGRRHAPARGRRAHRASWSSRCAIRSAPTSIACRSSRAGWTPTAKLHEKVYDVAWSGGRASPDADGKLPPVGNTVDLEARRPGPTPSAPPSWRRSGRTRTSTRPSGPSTTRACWRSRRRAGWSTTSCVSASRSPRRPSWSARSARTPHPSGTRRAPSRRCAHEAPRRDTRY